MLVATCECGFIVRSRLAPDQRLNDIDQQLDLHVCPIKAENRGIACPPGWDPLEWARFRFPSCTWDAEELAAHLTPVLVEEMAHKLEIWNQKQQRTRTREPLYVAREGSLIRMEAREDPRRRSKSRVYKVG